MKGTIKKSFNYAIIISDNTLKEIDDFIKTQYEYVKYSFATSDGAEYDINDIRDILNYQNPDQRKIVKIIIKANHKESLFSSQFNLLILDQNIAYKVISYEIKDEAEKELLYIHTHLDEIISKFKAPYSWLHKDKSSLFCVLFVWLMFSIPYLIYTNGKIDKILNFLFLQSFSIIIAYCSSFVYDKIINKYFPVTIFCIGEQLEQKQNKQRQMNVFLTIVGTLILGVIASLIAFWITTKL